MTTKSTRYKSLARCSFACGTRARYVSGCRCDRCRAANTQYARDREVRRRERIEQLARGGELVSSVSTYSRVLVSRTWTLRDGTKRVRRYNRPCPGVLGVPCSSESFLRKDSIAGVCARCRVTATFEGLVPANRARKHMRRLSRKGIGRRSFAAVSDVADTLLLSIRTGAAARISRRTERKVLDVDESCRADGATVPAGPTWRLIDELLALGWTRMRIAAALGSKSKTPALQISRDRVLLRSADAVERLHRKVTVAHRSARGCPRCGASHVDDPVALEWCLANQHVPVAGVEAITKVEIVRDARSVEGGLN